MIKKQKSNCSVWAFVGTNLCGKTVTLLKEAKEWKKKNPKGKIMCFDPQAYLRKYLKIDYLINSEQNLLKEIRKQQYKHKKILVVLDDYRLLMPDNGTSVGFLNLLKDRNELNIEIMYSTHRSQLILERLSYYTSKYSIFLPEEETFNEKNPSYYSCNKAAQMVKEFVGTKAPNAFYPNFPHIVVVYGTFEYNNMNNLN